MHLAAKIAGEIDERRWGLLAGLPEHTSATRDALVRFRLVGVQSDREGAVIVNCVSEDIEGGTYQGGDEVFHYMNERGRMDRRTLKGEGNGGTIGIGEGGSAIGEIGTRISAPGARVV